MATAAPIPATAETLATAAISVTSNTAAQPSGIVLDEFARLRDEDDRLAWAATQRALHDCMAERGYLNYPIEGYPEVGNAGLFVDGLPSLELVRQFGYNWSISARPAPPNPPSAEIQDAGFQELLNGDCAREALDRTGQTEYLMVRSLLEEVASEIRSSVEVDIGRELLGLWSACMADSGYPGLVDDRGAQELALSLGNQSISDPAAIQVAVSDYECQVAGGGAGRRRSEMMERSQRWIDENPGTVEEFNAAVKRLVQRCKGILAQ